MVGIAVLVAPLAVALGGAAARLGGARYAVRGLALACGVLIALVVADMIPDAVEDATTAGIPAAAPFAVAAAAAAAGYATLTALVLRVPGERDSIGCGCHAAGRVAAGSLAVHGLLEGAVLGFGLGVTRLAWLLVAAFTIHKAAEGYALAQGVRAEGGTPVRWLTLAALAPAVGALAGLAVPLSPAASSVVAAVVAGLLAAVAAVIARAQLRRHPVEALIAVGTGAVGLALLLTLGG